MSDTQLQPFAPPALFTQFHIGLSSNGAIQIMVAIVFGIWLIFTLIAIYHWIKYSHGSLVAFPAIAIHLVVSVLLMSFAISGSLVPTI